MTEKATLAWNDGEGYDIRYGELVRQYGIALPFKEACHKVPSMIQELVLHGEGAARQAAETEKKKADYAARVRELGDAQTRDRAELDTQRSYFSIEQKPEYRNRIATLETSLSNLDSELERMRSFLATPTPDGGLSVSDQRSLVAYMKFYNYLYDDVIQHVEVQRLERRNKGQPLALDADAYDRILEAFISSTVETVQYYDGNLMFTEAELELPDWSIFSQIGLEVIETLRRGKRQVHTMNGKLDLRYNADFYCEVSAVALQAQVDYRSFDIAMVRGNARQQHPVFADFSINPPQSFILFNDSVLVRHDFRIKRTSIASAMLKNPVADDDDE